MILKKKSYVLNVIVKSFLLLGPQGRAIWRERAWLSSRVMSADWFCPGIALTTSPHETMWIVITHCSSFQNVSDVIKAKCQRTAGFSTRRERTLGHDWTLEFISHAEEISCLCIPIRTKTSFTDQYLPIPATAIGPGKCLCCLFFLFSFTSLSHLDFLERFYANKCYKTKVLYVSPVIQWPIPKSL